MLIYNSKVSFSDIGPFVESSYNQMAHHISLLASNAFKQINELFEGLGKQLANCVWPYEDSPIENGETDPTPRFLDKVLLEAAENINRKGVKKPEASVMVPQVVQNAATVAHLSSMALVPFHLATSGATGNLTDTIFSAAALQQVTGSYYRQGMPADLKNHPFLMKAGLVPEMDAYDLKIYLASTAILSKVLTRALPSCNSSVVFKFGISVIATFPPIQNAVKKTAPFKLINNTVRNGVGFVKGKAIELVSQRIQVAALAKAKENSAAIQDFINHELFNFSDFKGIENDIKSLSPRGFDFLSLASDDLKEQAAISTGKIVQQAIKVPADLAASLLVDQIGGIALDVFESIFVTYKIANLGLSYPLFAALCFVVQGGTNQSVKQLALRVLGAALFLRNKSMFYPLLLINGIPLIEFYLKTRSKNKRIRSIGDESISSFCQNRASQVKKLAFLYVLKMNAKKRTRPELT